MQPDHQTIMFAWLRPRAYRCAICRRVDAWGSYGPRMAVDELCESGVPLVFGHERWFCARHSALLWSRWLILRRDRAERLRLIRAA